MRQPPKGFTAYETPPWLFRQLHEEFSFDVDAASSRENHLLPVFWTEGDDGLSRPWRGLRVFCNPPYGRDVGRWAEKAKTETGLGCPLSVLVLPGNVETAWFHESVIGVALELRFVKGRVSFYVNGKRAGRPAFSTVVAIYSEGICVETRIRSMERATEDLIRHGTAQRRSRSLGRASMGLQEGIFEGFGS